MGTLERQLEQLSAEAERLRRYWLVVRLSELHLSVLHSVHLS